MDTLTAEVPETEVLSARAKIAAYFELTKPRIAFMLVLTSAAGFYLGIETGFNLVLFLNSMAAITLLAFGVATLNQYIERNIDAKMERTSKRPIPTNRVSPNEALVFGIVLCVISEVYLYLTVNALTAGLGLVVIIGYVFLYTPLKTRTTASTAIGALPGAMPPLMGWTAASNEITLGAWFLFALLFLWQFPHFLAIAWMYKDQYAKAGIKMLPVVEKDGKITARQIVIFTVLLLPISLAPFFLGVSGIVYLVGASGLGLWFLYSSVRTARAKSVEHARKLLLVSVLY
ncbi:MAG: protoheme IX farnesyltransferase, partial [Pyrinomonadaceae bacterium]|nr:protoheme IX farnesyltransferase [Pyrinomonadaceae bacterium]